MGFKSGSRCLCSLGSNFKFLFFGGVASFVRFWGSFLRLEWPCRGALGVKNVQNPCIFQCFLQLQVVSSLKLVMALLGSCWLSCDALISKWVSI